jgi:NADPH:quinone reductase-like Zn-dependent oxidoreductase
MSIPTTMRALQQTSLNGPQDLYLITDAPVPSPGPGEVLIRVTAAGVNFVDISQAHGTFAGGPQPSTANSQASGRLPVLVSVPLDQVKDHLLGHLPVEAGYHVVVADAVSVGDWRNRRQPKGWVASGGPDQQTATAHRQSRPRVHLPAVMTLRTSATGIRLLRTVANLVWRPRGHLRLSMQLAVQGLPERRAPGADPPTGGMRSAAT